MNNSHYRVLPDRTVVSGVLDDVLGLFSETERVIARHGASVELLQNYAERLSEIRVLLNELSGYDRDDADGRSMMMSARYLSERCLDLEGRVKEKRNDLQREQPVGR